MLTGRVDPAKLTSGKRQSLVTSKTDRASPESSKTEKKILARASTKNEKGVDEENGAVRIAKGL
jgi:hypothetical protein